MAKLHNERIIAEIIEEFDDEMVTNMPNINSIDSFEYGMKWAMKDVQIFLSNEFSCQLKKIFLVYQK